MLAAAQSQGMSGAFPPGRRPLRLDLNSPFDPGRVVMEAAPVPILRLRNQAALDRVTVNVAHFFDALGFRPNRQVVIPDLPEPPLAGAAGAFVTSPA